MSVRVPAWKRLGLKLKGPASDEGSTPSSGGANAHQTRVNGSPASALKRNWQSANAVTAHTPHKRSRTDEQGTPSSLRKAVSFADDSKNTTHTIEPKKKKEKKKKVKKTSDAPKPDTDLEPSLIYLRQWHTARESWKFNKNHQTLLIKYFFDGDRVPSSDTAIFYKYIQDLKGFVRTRLRETAAEIKKKDMADGAGAFPAKIKDKESKQKEYEETVSRFLHELQKHQKEQNGTSGNTNGKRTLDEVEYVLLTTPPEVKQRLLKRIRAELVVDELSDDESTTSAATATTTTTTTSSTASGPEPTANKSRQSDGSQQPAKRRRLRNVRTDVGDDDSSSSDSDSESDADGSGSSDESEDEEMGNAPNGNQVESSSSNSSSSSESDSGSAAETEGEDESSSSSDSE
ncbi:hypothetical protein BT67DRAFT_438255 [Trichocladium antarcticum]|uniref:WKF domain-containing protein n=1 Tax=Trichocladium antarcticum TaxID=1450529 RepID=A0AAN6UTZ0_9PEZI|nr:hypothetical protein BT67DRAFT_438255 [Trichocladium antarcticum]